MGLLLSGLGAATGALGNTNAARTARSSSRQGGSYSNTSGFRRDLLPEQQGALQMLTQRANSQLANPGAGLEPFRRAAVNSINSSAAAAPGALAARYLGSGANRSGKYGRAARIAETGRLGAIANVDNQVGQMALTRGDEASALLERILGQNFGSTTTGAGSSDGFQSGTQTGAGSALAGGLGGGLATWQALMNMALVGGGGGSSGGRPVYDFNDPGWRQGGG